MTNADGALILAWIGAVCGPVILFFFVRRLLRGRRIFLGWSVAVATAGAWGLGVWAFMVEPATLTVRHVTVESDQWRGPPVRIGLISDTHVAAPHTDVARVRRLVERMNAERPDMVVLLGDYTGGHRPATDRSEAERAEILEGVEAFRGLRSPLGTWAVLGNHDSWFDDQAIVAALGRADATWLENRAALVERPAGPFWIGGLADMHSSRQPPLVWGALRDVPDGAPVILITHWPDPFVEVPQSVALTLAGHTHCGQVNLPLLGRLVSASPASRRWPCGLYDEGGRKLFVTGGIGVSILPVRFRAPPEIVVVTLRARRARNEVPTPQVTGRRKR